MCVSWELNPQPFALLTQCSTTEHNASVMEISLWVLIKTVKPIFKSVHYMFQSILYVIYYGRGKEKQMVKGSS